MERQADLVRPRLAHGVELSQRVFPWPDTGKTWVTAPRVGVTRLAAGETLTGTVSVESQHVLSQTAFRSAESPSTNSRTCRALTGR
jgi:hypothetical protein